MQLHSRLQLLPLSDAPAFLQLENLVSENVVKSRIERPVHFSRFSLARVTFFAYSFRIFRSRSLFSVFTDRELRSQSLSRVNGRIFASDSLEFRIFFNFRIVEHNVLNLNIKKFTFLQH